MTLIQWNQQYSVNDDAMDAQHRELFAILNQIHDVILKGHSQGLTWSLLERLILYTEIHFAAEEELMRTCAYPQLAAHTTRHRQLTAQVQDYVARLDRGDVIHNIDVLCFLSDWLREHIAHEDKAYSRWIAAQKLPNENLPCCTRS